MSQQVDLVVKWGGKEILIASLDEAETVKDLKERIAEQTGVSPQHQKLLGFKVKDLSDDMAIASLHLKPKSKIIMMGSQEAILAEVKEAPADLPEIADDLEISPDEVATQHREEFLSKIERRVKVYSVKMVGGTRSGKKLVVLDVDYTIFDHKSCAERGEELMRPYLHEFLTAAYEHYDIAVWSATGMKWIDAKLHELGVSSNPNYKIAFVLDSGAMISVYTEQHGLVETKPLGVIWGKFPDLYSPRNTLMVDDVSHNFLMNPQNGLKIHPFKNAHLNRSKDEELRLLRQYLAAIASLEDLSTLEHKDWKRFLKRMR